MSTGNLPAPKLGQRLELQIEKLAIGGYGIARHEGLVIFVAYSVPGDLLVAELTEKKKNHAFAEIVEVLRPSPHRVLPPCPYYYECGGCNWQHVSSAEQLRQKENFVRENLQKFLRREIAIQPIIPSPKNFRYRNRIQLASENGKLGFRKRRSHEIIDIEDCLITEEILARALPEIRVNLGAKTKRIELFLNAQEQARWEKFESSDESIGFSQVNRFQNKDLVEAVVGWAAPGAQSVLELYAGSGNFTWPLAEKFPHAKYTAVELNARLVSQAQEKNKSFPQVQFVAADVEKYLRAPTGETPDLVYLDPPRLGASPAIMQKLAELKPAQLLYLSCHPVSLARDLSQFLTSAEALGHSYQIARVQPFEMFPQSDHVESLVELRRTSEGDPRK